MRSLLATARIVQGAAAGAVLLRDGTICRLPGLQDHALLVAESPVVESCAGDVLGRPCLPVVHVAGPGRPRGATGHPRALNQQIAKALIVTPGIVAAHVEHLLIKLEAPTRTLAAVRAGLERWYVPPPQSDAEVR